MEEREVGAVIGDAWRLNACADDIATTSRTAARRDGEEDRCRSEQNGVEGMISAGPSKTE